MHTYQNRLYILLQFQFNLIFKLETFMSPVSPIFHIALTVLFGPFWNTQGLDMEGDLMRPNNI